MPGSLSLVSIPAGRVLPALLVTSFTEEITWPVDVSAPYMDGRQQRKALALKSRRSWAITSRLTYTQWLALRDFYAARKGALEPFYFYSRKDQYDPTGASATGRYAVRFDGALSNEYGIGKFIATLRLLEIA